MLTVRAPVNIRCASVQCQLLNYFLLVTDDVRWSITPPRVNLESPVEYEFIVGPDGACVRGPQDSCINVRFHRLSDFARHIHIHYCAIGTLQGSKWSRLCCLSGACGEEDWPWDRRYLGSEKQSSTTDMGLFLQGVELESSSCCEFVLCAGFLSVVVSSVYSLSN